MTAGRSASVSLVPDVVSGRVRQAAAASRQPVRPKRAVFIAATSPARNRDRIARVSPVMDTTTLAEETASSDRVCADGCERRRQGPKRIACVQLAPQHAAVKLNADTVRRLTQDLEPGTLDLLVLPEMALTGYIFADAESIAPLVEDPAPAQGVKGTSPSLDLARELATRLRCHVAIGFPCRWTPALERHMGTQQQTSRPYDARPPHLLRAANEPSTPSSSPGQIADASTSRTSGLYNAALLVDEKGALIHIARKHFAFDDDKRWSIEGPGFQTVHIPRLGKVCLAVCMDLNRACLLWIFAAGWMALALGLQLSRQD